MREEHRRECWKFNSAGARASPGRGTDRGPAAGSFVEVEPRDFKPMAIPGLEKEVRDAASAALKAMSSWRNDIADTSEFNGKRVIEKMAAAAAALGWPEQTVDAARVQMQSIVEVQIQTMDQMMDAWEAQLPAGGVNPLQFWMQFGAQWQKAGQTQ
jgi:hypothetical protein